jgi:RNA polymerase sigma factor (sigma-70 family)
MAPLLAQRARSDRAFERLYQRHVGDVYRYALVVMRNPSDAEDVTQTTFMNAYRAYSRGERPHTPQNWLITIAHNVCRQRFRQLQRRPNELPLEEEVAQTVPDDDSPTADDIKRALSHLAFNQRAALVMRELEGRSYAEIAEVLQLTTSAVETLIFRARRALREQLEGGLTCREAEFAISRQLDGRLPRKEKGSLRAHLRECEECARFARSQRAQRSAIKSLALIPVPSSLTSFFHHGGSAAAGAGAAAGGGVAMKAAIVGATAIVATGTGVGVARKAGYHPLRHGSTPAAQKDEAAATGGASLQATPTTAAKTSPTAELSRPKQLHGRLNAEGPTKNLQGRLRAEQPTTERGKAALAPGAVNRRNRGNPVHPVKPAHPTTGGQTKKAERVAKPKPKPKKHAATPPPLPPKPKPEKKPAPTVPAPAAATLPTPPHGKR